MSFPSSTSSVSKEDELESGNHQLVVKSTFLDVMDGFSAQAKLSACQPPKTT